MLLRIRNHRRAGSAFRAPRPDAQITLRPATAEDGAAVARLAGLYDRPVPDGPLLLAEVDGELQAALTLAGDRELMDPFRPTAALVDLLRRRAEDLRAHAGSVEATPGEKHRRRQALEPRLASEAGSSALLDCGT